MGRTYAKGCGQIIIFRVNTGNAKCIKRGGEPGNRTELKADQIISMKAFVNTKAGNGADKVSG